MHMYIVGLVFSCCVNPAQVTMETTTGNSNPDLWKHVSPQAVLEGVRSVVANRLATSGKEWTDTFALHNSGTCVLIRT